jgi:hypothetical protein
MVFSGQQIAWGIFKSIEGSNLNEGYRAVDFWIVSSFFFGAIIGSKFRVNQNNSIKLNVSKKIEFIHKFSIENFDFD